MRSDTVDANEILVVSLAQETPELRGPHFYADTQAYSMISRLLEWASWGQCLCTHYYDVDVQTSDTEALTSPRVHTESTHTATASNYVVFFEETSHAPSKAI